MNINRLKILLEKKYAEYNSAEFIENDPVSIPHRFVKKQDIEIMAFWTAMLSWGQRKTIINKCSRLIEIMEGHPFEFIISFRQKDLERFQNFRHRTFNYIDTRYFLQFFQWYYRNNETLETAFIVGEDVKNPIENALISFHRLFFSLKDAPVRTRKHVSTPERNSRCKRLNMFLRWMVRNNSEIDFGIWKNIQARDLLCPLDVHTERIARRFGLIKRKQADWQSVIELTANLRKLDPFDPVKYDIALFGMGVNEKKVVS